MTTYPAHQEGLPHEFRVQQLQTVRPVELPRTFNRTVADMTPRELRANIRAGVCSGIIVAFLVLSLLVVPGFLINIKLK